MPVIPATESFLFTVRGGRLDGAMALFIANQFYDWNFDQVYAEMKKYDLLHQLGDTGLTRFCSRLL